MQNEKNNWMRKKETKTQIKCFFPKNIESMPVSTSWLHLLRLICLFLNVTFVYLKRIINKWKIWKIRVCYKITQNSSRNDYIVTTYAHAIDAYLYTLFAQFTIHNKVHTKYEKTDVFSVYLQCNKKKVRILYVFSSSKTFFLFLALCELSLMWDFW